LNLPLKFNNKGLAADYLHSRIITLYLRDATEYLEIPQISPQFTRFTTTSYPVAPPYVEGGALPDELEAHNLVLTIVNEQH
jgi:hypothetical protein